MIGRLGRPEAAARRAGLAPDLEDVRRVHVELEVEHDELWSLAEVRDLDPLGEPAGDPAAAGDRQRPQRQRVGGVLLDGWIATRLWIEQLDDAGVI